MNLDSFLFLSKESIISKIINDNSLSEDKKRIIIERFLTTEYISRKAGDFKEKDYVSLPLDEVSLRNYHLKGEVNLTEWIGALQRKFRVKSEIKHMGLYNLQNVAIGNLQIHVQDLEKFIQEYGSFPTMKNYTIPQISKSLAIDWTNDFILKYADLLSFHYLHRNPNVIWNFELIEKLKERLNWSYISSYEYLEWTPLLLQLYKQHLVFSLQKTGWQKSGTNANGSTFSILHFHEYPPNPFSYLVGSISSSCFIVWTEEIIDSVIECWDWEELSGNVSVKWNAHLINKYKSFVNFDSLSQNTNVEWTFEILFKYENSLNWKKLSGNPSLPWAVGLIDQFINKWTWKPSYNCYFQAGWKLIPCLSTNEGILWTSNMVQKWKQKIDLWLIARNGKIPTEVLFEFRDEFRRKEWTTSIYHKYSDWRETEEVYISGWQCLLENENFVITKNMMRLLEDEYVELKLTVGYDFARTGAYEFRRLSLLELYKDCCLENISIQDIYEHYDSWGEIFINANFLNNSLYQKEILPYFENKMVQLSNT